MLHVNLLPWRKALSFRQKVQLKKKVRVSILIGVLAVAMLHAMLAYKIYMQQCGQQKLQDELDTVTQRAIIWEQLKQQQSQLLNELRAGKRMQEAKYHDSKLLTEVAGIVPKELYLTELQKNNDTIVLVGNAIAAEGATELLKNIMNSRLFEQPLLQELKRDTKDLQIWQFRIKMKIHHAAQG